MKQNKRNWIAVAATVFAVGQLANAEVINLTNASFETAIGGTNGVNVSGWFTFHPGNTLSGVHVNGDGFWNMANTDGPNAAYATNIGTSDGGAFYQTVELDAGVTYKLTAGVGMSTGAPKDDGFFKVMFYNLGFSSLLSTTDGTITTRGGFTDYAAYYTPTATTQYQVGVRNIGYDPPSTGADGTTVFFDNVRLEAVVPGSVDLLGNYQLGEAGSFTGGAPFTPLIDNATSIDATANNITNFQNTGGVASITSTGLAAPGSTGALQITNNAGGSSGWFANTDPFALADNWAFELWVRPDTSGGTILAQTDNSADGISIWAQNGADGNGADIAFAHGIGGVVNATSGDLMDYVVGEWYKINLIRYDGTNYYFVDGQLLASDTFSGLLNAPMLGFAAGGLNGTNAAYDEMKVWSFDPNITSLHEVIAATVPTPAALPAGLTLLILAAARRRRR